MLIADGKQELLAGASLKLVYAESLYYNAHYDGQRFLFDLVKVGKVSIRMIEEADWETFCRKVPAIVRDDPEWVQGPAQETTTLKEAQGGTYECRE